MGRKGGVEQGSGIRLLLELQTDQASLLCRGSAREDELGGL